MSKHYIAMAGLHGCLPNYCEPFRTKRAAIESLIDVHDVPRYGRVARELRSRVGYAELSLPLHGNEYAEIAVCECDNPGQHSEDGEWTGDY